MLYAARSVPRSTALMKLARASCIASPRGSITWRSRKQKRTWRFLGSIRFEDWLSRTYPQR